ncbi:unannotated protein [freshwater metagenome]|uniref:Unannotated protein n=1 Tax=freshwater metagenome TaxID=449393 RepID=A0A6J6W325_9ZZZZ
MRQGHRKNGVAGNQERGVRSDVGAGTRVWLQVGVISTKECLRPLDADVFCLVHLGASAVITLAGVTLGVLVTQRAAQSGEHRRASEVLTGNQLQTFALTVQFVQQHRRNFRVLTIQCGEVWSPKGHIGRSHTNSCGERG